VTDTIIYEQPLNERIRTFLRLEYLFSTIDHALQNHNEHANRTAISGLLDIVAVFERSDLKAEIIKEVERLVSYLSSLENTPGVDNSALEALLVELDQILDALHLNKAAIGQSLRDNEFLYAIRQRSSIPGGTCDFDLPTYHYWLQHLEVEQRQHQIMQWYQEFSAVRSAIDTTLKLIRGSTGFTAVIAPSGFYQQSLDSNQPTQLIRVMLPQSAQFYPEISGGKHRFTVRCMQFDIEQRPKQSQETLEFQLSCCVM
jgi:cell division protein ZapD